VFDLHVDEGGGGLLYMVENSNNLTKEKSMRRKLGVYRVSRWVGEEPGGSGREQFGLTWRRHLGWPLVREWGRERRRGLPNTLPWAKCQLICEKQLGELMVELPGGILRPMASHQRCALSA
jgi:hypothetical protein